MRKYSTNGEAISLGCWAICRFAAENGGFEYASNVDAPASEPADALSRKPDLQLAEDGLGSEACGG